MRRKTVAIAFSLALLISTVAGTSFVTLATASLPITPTIPEGRAYTVTNYNAYNTNDITLYFLVDHDDNYKGIPISTGWYGYSLDGTNITFPFVPSYQTFEYHYYGNGGKSVTEVNAVNLYDLSEGAHNITIYAKLNQLIAGNILPIDVGSTLGASNTKLFTIDTTLPIVAVLAPMNRTYNTSEVPLNFTVSEPFSQITYRLNDLASGIVDGNTTLVIADGEYSLTLFASDIAGNTGASETINFTVAQNQETKPVTQQSVPFPTTYVVIVVVVGVALIGASLLVYFKKQKQK